MSQRVSHSGVLTVVTTHGLLTGRSLANTVRLSGTRVYCSRRVVTRGGDTWVLGGGWVGTGYMGTGTPGTGLLGPYTALMALILP